MSDTRQNFSHKRMKNEFATICAMIEIYCRAHHSRPAPDQLCGDCSSLRDYAHKRLQRCPFQEVKPTCGNCTIHCYQKAMREKIKDVMRFAGPRMTYKHPVMAFRHLLDNRRKPREIKKNRPSGSS